ncbi:hypothetical protein ACFFRR_005793 [Megaselia abdita]
MRGFILICLVSLSVGAPQGYNYQQQHATSFGASSIATTGSSSSNFLPSAPSSGYLAPTNTGFSSGYSSHGQQQHSHHQEAIVSKKFFIHSAPEENDDDYKERTINVGTPRKNYNVVFIKAPYKSSKGGKLRIVPATNEEKTVIYVLNKKTDAADIHAEVQDVVQTTNKPEVFFIKYKTAEEAHHAQQQIQAQYDALGGSTQVTDEGVAPVSSVIGSLGQAGHQQSHTDGIAEQHTSSHIQSVGHQSNNGYLPPNFY